MNAMLRQTSFVSRDNCFISLHDSVVINSTSGSDIHDGHAELVIFTAYTTSSAETGATILQNTAKLD